MEGSGLVCYKYGEKQQSQTSHSVLTVSTNLEKCLSIIFNHGLHSQLSLEILQYSIPI
jgi:hypothetical protein